MNVEGDFRYVEYGAFDECIDFLEYLDDCRNDWNEAFVGWIGVSERWKKERKMSQNYWGPLNLVKVLKFSFLSKLKELLSFRLLFCSSQNKLVTSSCSCSFYYYFVEIKIDYEEGSCWQVHCLACFDL